MFRVALSRKMLQGSPRNTRQSRVNSDTAQVLEGVRSHMEKRHFSERHMWPIVTHL